MHANSTMKYISKQFLNDNNILMHNETINETVVQEISDEKSNSNLKNLLPKHFWNIRASHMNS